MPREQPARDGFERSSDAGLAGKLRSLLHESVVSLFNGQEGLG